MSLLLGLQTWKKLQAVQAALADILSEITLFWGHFESKDPVLLTEDGGKRVEYRELRMDRDDLRLTHGEWNTMGFGLRKGIEDSIMPHQDLMNIFQFILFHDSGYFKAIVQLWIFAWGLSKIFPGLAIWNQTQYSTNIFLNKAKPCIQT